MGSVAVCSYQDSQEQLVTKSFPRWRFWHSAHTRFAQLDLSGSWVAYNHEDAMERGSGPEPVDYLGLPLTEEGARTRCSYSASQIAMPERQCLYYTSEYLVGGPFGFKMWSETEPVNGQTIAWHISGTNDRAPLTIWVDGRPDASKYSILLHWRIRHGRMGRRRSEGSHHPYESGLSPAQRVADQR